MARILAIDYGLKRVGIAVTDELQIIAQPLRTEPTSNLFSFLKEYVRQEDVECFVVGEPDQETDSSEPIRKFVRKLKETFPSIPVHMEDESFTSKMAAQAMIEAGVKKKDRQKKENLDKISASLILRSFLEKKL